MKTIILLSLMIFILISGCIDYSKYNAYVDDRDNSIIYERGNCFIYYSNYTDRVVASSDSTDCAQEDFNNYWIEQNKIGEPIKATPIPTRNPEPDCDVQVVGNTIDIACSNGYSYHRVDDVYRENGVRPPSLVIPKINPIKTPIPTPVQSTKNCDIQTTTTTIEIRCDNGYIYMQDETTILEDGVRPNDLVIPTLKYSKPTPTPTTDNSKKFWKWFKSVQKPNWIYEKDYSGELVNEPTIANANLRGDCDDFATMVAYYGQEVYGFDTIVIEMTVDYKAHTATYTNNANINHAVAMIKMDDSGIQSMANSCSTKIPSLNYNGNTYYPLDWDSCPDWLFKGNLKGMPVSEWNDLVGTER